MIKATASSSPEFLLRSIRDLSHGAQGRCLVRYVSILTLGVCMSLLSFDALHRAYAEETPSTSSQGEEDAQSDKKSQKVAGEKEAKTKVRPKKDTKKVVKSDDKKTKDTASDTETVVKVSDRKSKAKSSAELKRVREREQQLKESADEAYNQRDYQKALDELQKAYLLTKNPRYIANQGLVFEDMKRYKEAVDALEFFIQTKPSKKKIRSAQQVINRLRPEVKIITDPSGAVVRFKSEKTSSGKTPLKLRLISGEHPMTLTADNYEPLSVTLFVIPDKPVLAQYKLRRIGWFGDDETQDSTHQPETSQRRWGTGVKALLILGGLGAGLSLTSWWLTRSALIERDASVNSAQWEIAQNDAKLFYQLSNVSIAVSIGAMIGGLTWLYLSASPSSSKSTKIQTNLSPLGLSGRF
jgi:tetratricopeptide (TPR) repeat protein